MNYQTWIRPNIAALTAYSCARTESNATQGIFLDANENPYATDYNRYPDPYQKQLKQKLASIKQIPADYMVLGNGSDELIDLILRAGTEPGKDNIVFLSPGYGMYKVQADIHGIEARPCLLTPTFQPDWQKLDTVIDANTKVVFFCTPNNPTGNEIPIEQIATFATRFPGIVVIDEAYIDFGTQPSAITLLKEYPNIVVLQTLSKAWGLAGVRLGIGYMNPELACILNKIKYPYNISSVSQRVALRRLNYYDVFQKECDELKEQRTSMYAYLAKSPLFDMVYPSQANFILVTTPYASQLYDYLTQNGIIVRRRNEPPRIVNGLRFTIGTPAENNLVTTLLTAFKPA
ncbi:MAG: histidinol-phosphate transaminase [Marinifilaceae bacterium]